MRKSARESAKKMTQKRHPRSLVPVGAGGSFAIAGPFSAWSCREGSESEDGGDMAAGGKHERTGAQLLGRGQRSKGGRMERRAGERCGRTSAQALFESKIRISVFVWVTVCAP